MSDLRKATIKLAFENPELREHLLPLIHEASAEEKEAKFEKGKKVDVAKWLKDNGHAEAAKKWEEWDGTLGKKASDEDEKEAKFEKGKKVDVGKWLKDNGHADAAEKWEKWDGTLGKKASDPVLQEAIKLAHSNEALRPHLLPLIEESMAQPLRTQPDYGSKKKTAAGLTEKDFDSLKKGSRVRISYNSVMSATNNDGVEFEVGRSSFSKKHNVHSKTLYRVDEDGKPVKRGAPYKLYKRGNGMITMGHGNMGVMIKSFRKVSKVASKWEGNPKGWTNESRAKFWDTMTGDAKHKVTKCIAKMDGKVDDPGAFCASLADRVEGKGWRSEKKASKEEELKRSIIDLKKQLAQMESELEGLSSEQFGQSFSIPMGKVQPVKRYLK